MSHGVCVFFLSLKSALSTYIADGRIVCIDNYMNFALCLSREISSVSKKILKNASSKDISPGDRLLIVDSELCQFLVPRNFVLTSGFSPAVCLAEVLIVLSL